MVDDGDEGKPDLRDRVDDHFENDRLQIMGIS